MRTRALAAQHGTRKTMSSPPCLAQCASSAACSEAASATSQRVNVASAPAARSALACRQHAAVSMLHARIEAHITRTVASPATASTSSSVRRQACAASARAVAAPSPAPPPVMSTRLPRSSMPSAPQQRWLPRKRTRARRGARGENVQSRTPSQLLSAAWTQRRAAARPRGRASRRRRCRRGGSGSSARGSPRRRAAARA
jgi:hypothetical protein